MHYIDKKIEIIEFFKFCLEFKNLIIWIMDFIINHPTISNFLNQFPSENWKEILIEAILRGIPHISPSLHNNYKDDQSSLPLLRKQLNSMKEELEKLNKSLEEPKNSLKSLGKKPPPEIKTPKKSERKTEETPRFQKHSPNKYSISPIRSRVPSKTISQERNKSSSQWYLAKPQPKPRTIPKYLKNVDSKIKYEVQKDIANYKSLIESMPEDSIEKSSLSIIDLSDKDIKKESQAVFFDSNESKSNSFSMNSEVRLITTLEGTFTNQDIAHKIQPSQEIPIDRDFETPRYPSEYHKDNQESEILEIAESFLTGTLMAELSNLNTSIDRKKCIYSQQIPPLDLLSSEENITPFRQRWEEATKDIGKKWETDGKTKENQKSTTSREFYSGRSSGMMMVQTPSPIPYDDKLGPMYQDATY